LQNHPATGRLPETNCLSRHALHTGRRRAAKTFLGLIYPLLFWGSPLAAQSFLEDTHFFNVTLGSYRSAIAQDLSIGGYELAQDEVRVDFEDLYRPKFPDMNFLFLTELNSSLGLIWGFSLGERGVKYRIDPGLWLGLAYQQSISRRSSLVFSALTLVGGDFRERPCLADYEGLGRYLANCRLAASELPPAETLQFLVNARGFRGSRISVRYQIYF